MPNGSQKSTAPSAPTVTTTGVHRLLLAVYGIRSTATFTPAVPMIERADQASGNVSAMAATEQRPTAGATGARTATSTINEAWASQLIALRPASAQLARSLTVGQLLRDIQENRFRADTSRVIPQSDEPSFAHFPRVTRAWRRARVHVGRRGSAAIVAAVAVLVMPVQASAAVTIDTTGCTGSDLSLGTTLADVPALASSDCSVGFSTDTGNVQLRMYQQDGAGTAVSGIPDWTVGTDDWGAGEPLFGACLRGLSAVAISSWTIPGDATCDATAGDPWNPVVQTSGSPGSVVAELGTGSYTADLRFGVQTVTTTAPGAAAAPIVIEVIQTAPPPPSSTGLPVISGTTTTGQTLSTTNSTWSGAPSSYAYQWRRCNAAGASCADIVGATANTYALVAADVDATIRVVVTATNGSGSTPATSAQTAVIAGVAPSAGTATISGTATVGQLVTGAAGGGWTTGTPAGSDSYQWRRCNAAGAGCVDIAGAVASTYVLADADVDQTVRVVVTRTNTCTIGCGAASATSVQTAQVAGTPPAAGTASASGINGYGETLSAGSSGWSNGRPAGTYGHQWRRCDAAGANCVDIGGATASTYVLAAADVGATLRVVITVTNTCVSGCGAASATSAATSIIKWIAPFATPSTFSSASPTSLSVSKPALVAPGHVMVAILCVRDGTDQTITPPAGWTLVRRTDNSNRTALASYYRVADGSESATFSYSWTVSRDATLGLYALSGVDNATPIDASSGATGNSATATAASVTTTDVNHTILYASCIRSSGTFSPPGGMVETWDHDASGVSGASDIEVVSAAGATGTRASTFSGSGAEWSAQLIALNRAP